MSVALGTNNINEIYVGNTPIKKIYYAVTSSDVRVVYEHKINYIVFEGIGVVTLVHPSSTQTLQYSRDGITWTAMSKDDEINTLTETGNTPIYIRGKGCSNSTTDFTMLRVWGGELSVRGNISALWDYEDLNKPLSPYCGYHLFNGSYGLVDASELVMPNTTASHCYDGMFSVCRSLTKVPKLPATTLADYCYYEMFWSCTSLTTVPDNMLPATTLANDCYNSMFRDCTGLTRAPFLDYTGEIPKDAYYYMFEGCTNLQYVRCLATSRSATTSTFDWLAGVASDGTFVKNSKASFWTRTNSGIPISWTIVNKDV